MISIGNSVKGAKIGFKHSFYEKVTALGEYLVEKGDQGVAEARAEQSLLDGFLTGKAAKAKPEERVKIMTEQFRREKHAHRAASHLEAIDVVGDKPITHEVLTQTKVRCGFYINEDGEIVDLPVEPPPAPQPEPQPDEVKQAPQPEVKQGAPPPPKPKTKPQPKVVVNDPIVNNPPPPTKTNPNPVPRQRPARVKGSMTVRQPQFDADEFAAQFMND